MGQPSTNTSNKATIAGVRSSANKHARTSASPANRGYLQVRELLGIVPPAEDPAPLPPTHAPHSRHTNPPPTNKTDRHQKSQLRAQAQSKVPRGTFVRMLRGRSAVHNACATTAVCAYTLPGFTQKLKSAKPPNHSAKAMCGPAAGLCKPCAHCYSSPPYLWHGCKKCSGAEARLLTPAPR